MLSKLIIYGAGTRADKLYKFLSYSGLADRIYGFCETVKEKDMLHGLKVFSYDEIKTVNIPFVIGVDECNGAFNEIESILKNDNKTYYENVRDWAVNSNFDMIKFERDTIAFAHINNSYFQRAENEDAMHVFWGGESAFYNLFQKLNLKNVLELACGEGRHVRRYACWAEKITLVDILETNIEVCRKRFKDLENISYYVNNGRDLREMEDDSFTAIFSYDAMVHFDMLDVRNYLKEFFRILKPNGMALLHHSNLHSDYKTSFETGEGNRNYMSKNLFAHMAYQAGLSVITQIVIDWYGVKELDCISLLQKNRGI